MKRSLSLAGTLWLVFFYLLPVGQVTAQSVASKVSSGTHEVNSTNGAVKGATSTLADTKKTVNDAKEVIGSLFKKKRERKKPVSDSLVNATTSLTTVIMVTGSDYTSLKMLEDSLQLVEGVSSTKKAFHTGSSMIEVNYEGEADELWDAMPVALKEQFELKALEDKKIVLQYKEKV